MFIKMSKKVFFTFNFLLTFLCIYGQNEERLPLNDSNLYNRYFYDTDLISPGFFKKNRERLREKMPKGSVAVFFAAPEKIKSNDVLYEYHQNPDFYYLTGLRETDAILLIFKDPVEIKGKKVKELMYVRERQPKYELWSGRRLGPEGVMQYLQLEMALASKDFLETTDLDFSKFKQIYWKEPDMMPVNDPFRQGDLYDLLNYFFIKTENVQNKLNDKNLSQWMAELREVKHPDELVLLQKAIDITCTAQIELMKKLQPGMKEYQSEAIIEYIFKYSGAEEPGFPSILGSGENSCILHYNTNRRPMKNNDLLIVDIGAEYHGYSADVTRTLPVNGKFSPEQKIIYDLVLKAQEAGIEACRKGNKFWDPHYAALKVIAEGLKELGIINDPDQANWYFPHGTSHYLGLDVHDAGTYGPLKPGNVITVEPGIYIPEGSPCDKKWWNIGVRIEDDILITEDDPVILSIKAPRTTEEIEKLMNGQNP